MAEPIEQLTEQQGHPWEDWANGQAWRLTQGKDFECTMTGFRQTLYSHAKKSGLRVAIREIPETPGVMEIQFTK